MITTRLQVRDRIIAGVAWLDETVPDWRDRVNVPNLDLGSGERCVLGQVFSDFAKDRDSGFVYAIETYGNFPLDCDWQIDRCFAYTGALSWSHEHEVMTRAWKLVLAA